MMNKKGANGSGIAAGVIVLVIIVILFLYGPYLLNSLGFSPVPTATSLNHTVAVGVISVNAPAKVSPSSTFGATFLVANNLNGKAASNIYFCLDNLGLFTILSSPETSSPNPNGNAITSGRCVSIPSLATGDILSEGFTFSAPPANAYGNIQYSQNLGYYLNFSYVATASQQLEFVSQSASTNGNYPAPVTQPSDVTAGPIYFSSSSSQPVVYGQDIELGLSLNNVGSGVPIGNTQINIILNSSIINITDASALGFTVKQFSNGTAMFSKTIVIGPTGASIELPISLSTSEFSKLSGSSIPYIQANMHFSVSYSYEEEGYFPVGLYIEPYST
ncbi:MAG: hypothetical protein OH338_03080 [Candidatus Parvarchaeota archaeon]|jgi:hypothetical protein|nr:hypothetical protein [Candidatus Parvarchaeota archaeon]MCW1295639.1 hypothetical protein [Candidatus Parvarchaeum tengchongense]MCW1298723.1 hypothetical protein [Candidatus Parvarchaeum tengchongense]MCW1312388.1 hypothetical protein [Candidatus Parvarchaeum tengchongense]